MITRRPGWRPPHCPNSNCKYHNHISPSWRYKRKGYYVRQCAPHRIQRFTCLHCNRNFSSQTFSTTYWLKRPTLLARIFAMVVGCMGNRQMARALGCAHSSVASQISRLGRHSLLFQARDLEKLCIDEIVIDGFESFEWSQYFPFHHNVAVDPNTGFFVFHTDSPLRRKGRMTSHQKRRRAQLEESLPRAAPKAVETGMRELLEVVTRGKASMRIRSDDHRAYPRAMRSLPCDIEHHITSSKERRDARNPLWEVNRLDLMIRHSTAAHKRETIAWAKRRQVSAEKLSIFQVWYNYVKRRWEKGGRESAAMLHGLAPRMLSISDILSGRLFRTRVELPERWAQYYNREVVTPALGVNRRHTLTFAY